MKRTPISPRLIVLMSVQLLSRHLLISATAPDNYSSVLGTVFTGLSSNLPAIASSASEAAGVFVSGGNLWVAGRQPDFIADACTRAGGLTFVAPLGQHSPTNGDIILYTVPGSFGLEDQHLRQRWESSGATVVAFSSSAGLYQNRFPLDTVANVAELWAWTGEFVAACTRLGKMPVLYQSYGLPGGVDRGKRYQGKRFHDDLTIKPVPPRVLGTAYLEQLDRMLNRIQSQTPGITRAAGCWRQAVSSTIFVTGHMFPQHALDPRAPPLGNILTAPAWEDKDLLDPVHPPAFAFYLGYQFAPAKLLHQAQALGTRLVYTDVQAAHPPQPGNSILFIDPGWPLSDACVTVPGYDISILPASGVLQAAILWSIASEREKLRP